VIQPPPPNSPADGLRAPVAPRPQASLFGVVWWVWLVAWVPLLPAALMTLVAPAFMSPLFETSLSILALLALPLINLAVARAIRNDAAITAAIVLTTAGGGVIALFGPMTVAVIRTVTD
jgi:hypothetical protein